MRPLLPRITAAHRLRTHRSIGWHAHASPELTLVLRGRIRLEIPACGFSAEAGPRTLVLRPAHHRHRAVLLEGPLEIVYVLSPDLGRWLAVEPQMVALPVEEAAIGGWLEDLARLMGERPPDLDGAGHLLAAALARLARLQTLRAAHVVPPGLRRALRALQADGVGVAEAARLAGLPERTLRRRFHKHLATSPRQARIVDRLERARTLLSTSEASVTAIARQVGCHDGSHLARLMRRHLGCSPGDLRHARR